MKQKKRIALILAVCMTAVLLWGCADSEGGTVPPAETWEETIGSEETVEQTTAWAETRETVPGAYTEILDAYAEAVAEDWDPGRLMDAGMNYLIADRSFRDAGGALGYAVTDLDGDGAPELVIGSLTEDYFYGKMIFLLYTLDGEGAPMPVFESIERDRYYYAGGFRFANLGTFRWNESYVTTRKLENRELIDMTCTTDPADYVQMELTPFRQEETP